MKYVFLGKKYNYTYEFNKDGYYSKVYEIVETEYEPFFETENFTYSADDRSVFLGSECYHIEEFPSRDIKSNSLVFKTSKVISKNVDTNSLQKAYMEYETYMKNENSKLRDELYELKNKKWYKRVFNI